MHIPSAPHCDGLLIKNVAVSKNNPLEDIFNSLCFQGLQQLLSC